MPLLLPLLLMSKMASGCEGEKFRRAFRVRGPQVGMADDDSPSKPIHLFAIADTDGNKCVTYDELLDYVRGSPHAEGIPPTY